MICRKIFVSVIPSHSIEKPLSNVFSMQVAYYRRFAKFCPSVLMGEDIDLLSESTPQEESKPSKTSTNVKKVNSLQNFQRLSSLPMDAQVHELRKVAYAQWQSIRALKQGIKTLRKEVEELKKSKNLIPRKESTITSGESTKPLSEIFPNKDGEVLPFEEIFVEKKPFIETESKKNHVSLTLTSEYPQTLSPTNKVIAEKSESQSSIQDEKIAAKNDNVRGKSSIFMEWSTAEDDDVSENDSCDDDDLEKEQEESSGHAKGTKSLADIFPTKEIKKKARIPGGIAVMKVEAYEHPLKEWVSFVEYLNCTGYLNRAFRQGQGPINLAKLCIGSNMGYVLNAALSFAKDCPDAFRALPLEDVKLVVLHEFSNVPSLTRVAQSNLKSVLERTEHSSQDICPTNLTRLLFLVAKNVQETETSVSDEVKLSTANIFKEILASCERYQGE